MGATSPSQTGSGSSTGDSTTVPLCTGSMSGTQDQQSIVLSESFWRTKRAPLQLLKWISFSGDSSVELPSLNVRLMTHPPCQGRLLVFMRSRNSPPTLGPTTSTPVISSSTRDVDGPSICWFQKATPNGFKTNLLVVISP